jgi:hypothetical protein
LSVMLDLRLARSTVPTLGKLSLNMLSASGAAPSVRRQLSWPD